jgi:hypothetical protein
MYATLFNLEFVAVDILKILLTKTGANCFLKLKVGEGK